MNPAPLKERLQQRLWEVVDAQDDVVSATLTGSFADRGTLLDVSDIDLVVIVERLNRACYERLVKAFQFALTEILAAEGFRLRINPTLGPLKFNEPDVAVLHLMFYSREAHVQHVIASPFTCFDWQRSQAYRKRSLAEVFPVFNLQPRHFMSARRGLQDYLRDFERGVVSYRELICDEGGYRESPATQPMSTRDRHEFAYHILRFLMTNLVKLVRRDNRAAAGSTLLDEYFCIFPEQASQIRQFYFGLQQKKQTRDFDSSLPNLADDLHAFVTGFEAQFRREFITDATRHVAIRHAATEVNRDSRHERVFLGRSDPTIKPISRAAIESLRSSFEEMRPHSIYSSPAQRCRQTLEAIGTDADWPAIRCDERLHEIDYGSLEGLSVSNARQTHGGLFEAWQRGEDPRFPGGENTTDVSNRALAMVREHWHNAPGNSLTCTHNVVLRCLVGHTLAIPPHHWHRLEIPHLTPITFIHSRSHGLFVDIDAEAAATIFADFALPEEA